LSTYQKLFSEGLNLLRDVPTPAIEAKILLLEALRKGEVEWLASPHERVPKRGELSYRRLIERRLSGIPLAYITGKKEFWSLSLQVLPGVLIPRPETELIVEKTLEVLSIQGPRILDIGTGCGNIALALAKELPQARIIATDISTKALRNAELNIRFHRLENVRLVKGSLFSGVRRLDLDRKCEAIVSNPPYVSAADWKMLPAEVKDHEPRRALIGGKTGLEFIGRLIRGSAAFLKTGGYLLFEVGEGQVDRAVGLLGKDFSNVESFADLKGIPRCVRARRA
jgi:release factor glutamine methyltransferase